MSARACAAGSCAERVGMREEHACGAAEVGRRLEQDERALERMGVPGLAGEQRAVARERRARDRARRFS